MKKQAFTLLEIIIMLGIAAVVMGMGTYSLITFRNYTQVQNVYTDIVSVLRQEQNKAKNSITSEQKAIDTGSIIDSIPDYYAVFFESNNYSIYYCEEISDRVNCFVENQNLKKTKFSGVSVNINCGVAGIAFEKLTGDIVGIQSNGSFVQTGVCSITITRPGASSTKSLRIDLVENSIDAS